MKYGYLDDVKNVDFLIPEGPAYFNDFIPYPQQEKLEFYIGSSVWADKDFKGHFYPEKTAQKNFLLEYGKQFNTVEVNATRYGTPKSSTLETWKNSVTDDFRFSFKMPQIISVRKNLLDKDVLSRLEEFVIAMDKMGPKAGTTFILLQNNFNESRLEELNSFLSYLPIEQQYAVEIRNPSFNQSKELAEVLFKNNVANVITDTAGEREVVSKLVTNNTAFIRFVGNGLVDSDYKRIDYWVNQFKIWQEQGVRKFYCLHHQPNQNRRFAGYSAAYMLKKIKDTFKNQNIKIPHNYSSVNLF